MVCTCEVCVVGRMVGLRCGCGGMCFGVWVSGLCAGVWVYHVHMVMCMCGVCFDQHSQ